MRNREIDFWYQVGLDDQDDARMTFEEQQQFLEDDRYNTKRVHIDENLNAYRYNENRERVYL